MRTHYDTLSVSENAPDEVIRAAYKALALRSHPDRNNGNSKSIQVMQSINEAYSILSDKFKRKEYDRHLSLNRDKNSSHSQSSSHSNDFIQQQAKEFEVVVAKHKSALKELAKKHKDKEEQLISQYDLERNALNQNIRTLSNELERLNKIVSARNKINYLLLIYCLYPIHIILNTIIRFHSISVSAIKKYVMRNSTGKYELFAMNLLVFTFIVIFLIGVAMVLPMRYFLVVLSIVFIAALCRILLADELPNLCNIRDKIDQIKAEQDAPSNR